MDDFKDWIDYAVKDLESAKYLLNMKPCPLEIICYHCQQSAEKMLKSLMIKSNISLIKTHDLILLLSSLESIFDICSIKNECAELTNYSVITRYPYYFGDSINISMTNHAIKSAEKIFSLINNLCK